MKARKPRADVELERRQGRVVGVATLAAVVATFAALLVALSAIDTGSSTANPGADDQAKQFLDFHDAKATAALGAGLRAVGIVLVVVLAVYLYRVIAARREEPTPPWMLWLGIVGAVLMAIAAISGFFAISHVVDTYLASGPRTDAHAKQVADDSAFFRLQQVGQIVVRVPFALWLALACSTAMGVGLIPKFLAYYGYGAAVALVLAPFAGDSLFLGWLASMGLIVLNWWPGGRPEAWETGTAVPWPAITEKRRA
jgi:hypothetical protein